MVQWERCLNPKEGLDRVIHSSFSFLLNLAFNNGVFKETQICRRGLGLTHLFFVDNSMIFGEASTMGVMTIKDII
ncbi:hypothetical protein EPI10_029162 [Gossypium australe]|uniref:Reverse transcriptase n=1 Tax=Gossypium australe TaxID=47621 RepID=A0A5B6V0U5_9ROSI|nr:hypothetical protein EPI10_029162 [Gossypium australe]